MTINTTTKRIAATLVAAAAAASLSACGDKAGESDTAASSTAASATATSAKETSSASATSSAAASQTVKLSTVVGKDTITADFPVDPKTVVAMGQVAIDNLLTIGVTPNVIVVSDRELNIPWQAGKLDNAKVIKVASFKDFKGEEIAAEHPDLIVGDQWRVSDKTYEKLEAIAPTLGAVPGGKGWIDQVEALGKIYNKEDQATKAIAANKELFAKAQEDMPGLKGKTGIISQYIGDSKQFGVVADPDIPGSSFLKDLGMTIPESITSIEDRKFGRVNVAAENISLLDADFMVIGTRGATNEELKAVPGFENLPQVVSGATVIVDKPAQLQALNQPSALSLAYALKEFAPQLKKAAGE